MEEAIPKTKKIIKDAPVRHESIRFRFLNKKTKKIVSILIFLIVLGVAVYSSYMLYRVKDPAFQQKQIDAKTQQIVTQVGKLIELPDETPQVATVADVETLKTTQPFFDKAMNGDQVLVYSNQAILYRPEMNKIINVGTVNRTDEKATPKPVESDILSKEKSAEIKGENKN